MDQPQFEACSRSQKIDFKLMKLPQALVALYLPIALPAFAIAVFIAAVVISSSLAMN